MNKKGMAALLLTMLLLTTACQKPAVETPPAEPVQESAQEETAQAPDATTEEAVETQVNEEGKKRIEGPFQDMIAPDFTLPDADGAQYSLSDFKGNAVALVFWTSW